MKQGGGGGLGRRYCRLFRLALDEAGQLLPGIAER